MLRVAFTHHSGKDWTGGFTYLLYLARILSESGLDRIQPVFFAGTEADESTITPFTDIPGVQMVRLAEFDSSRKGERLSQSMLLGCDRAAVQAFRQHDIDVVFEAAHFHGWRFPIPAVAWLMDFQHRHLKHLFSASIFWKRELGYQAQIRSGRQIMLSSNDSRKDCEHFYPSAIGRTSVVRFAVQPPVEIDYSEARSIAETYGLPEHFFYLPNQFWKHKNHRIVIEALHLLKQQGKDVVVAASGQPVDSRHPGHFLELQDLVESYGLTENFRFVGMVPRNHVFALMRASTALINPSLFEGWSTPVEEAKSLGVPLLLSKLGVHLEQAEGFASFFDAQDPAQLASLLAAQKPLPLAIRRQMAETAIAESKNRVRQYALDFSQTIERAADTFRGR